MLSIMTIAKNDGFVCCPNYATALSNWSWAMCLHGLEVVASLLASVRLWNFFISLSKSRFIFLLWQKMMVLFVVQTAWPSSPTDHWPCACTQNHLPLATVIQRLYFFTHFLRVHWFYPDKIRIKSGQNLNKVFFPT